MLATLIAAASLGALFLWRPRRLFVWTVGWVVLSGVLIAGWWWRQTAVQQRSGDIVVQAGTLTQVDQWAWQTTPIESSSSLRWVDVTLPVFAESSQLRDSSMELDCGGDGQPFQFWFVLHTNARLAFVARLCADAAPAGEQPAVRDIFLADVADGATGSRQLYLNPGRVLRATAIDGRRGAGYMRVEMLPGVLVGAGK